MNYKYYTKQNGRIVNHPSLHIYIYWAQAFRLTREQETSRKREREAEIYRKGARCLGLYTEILSSGLPQVSTNLFGFFEMFTDDLLDLV
jgi:hypothetical protein